MNAQRAGVLLKLAGLVAAAAVAVGLHAGENARGQGELYVYATGDSRFADESCGFDYVDLDARGKAMTLQAGQPGANADDQAAVLELAEPFELYQSATRSLVVSDNGYLAVAGSLDDEDGSDFSNDCGLPVLADNPAARQERIYVYHDDLRRQDGGSVRQAYFPECPRASAAGSTEACTVVEWKDFEKVEPIPSSQPLRMQAVLYHRSREIAMQYASVDDSQAAQATIGLQGFEGRVAREVSCNVRRRVAARQALCFFDPRHPPSAGGGPRPSR